MTADHRPQDGSQAREASEYNRKEHAVVVEERSCAEKKRRQAGRTPNASRNSEALGTARQRLECAELAPAFGAAAGVEVVARGEKAPASRAHSKRFAVLRGTRHVAPAFGVRGAC